MSMNEWTEICNDQARLMVVECDGCGMHHGVDLSYLEDVGPVEFDCNNQDCANIMLVGVG